MTTATTEIDTEAQTLRIERDFKAPIERVFEAMINPEHAAKWWGPEGMDLPVLQMDVRVGGAWLTVIESEEHGSYTASGVYTRIEPSTRLAYTWGWVENGVRGHETLVDITLTPIEGGTRFSMIQSLFETLTDRDDHDEGWQSSLVCLEKFLAAG